MSGFFKGFLCGVGIGLVIAPLSGQEMRRLAGERIQTLYGSLPATEQLQQYSQQISDRTTQVVSALKDTPVLDPMKEVTSKLRNASQQTFSKSKQAENNATSVTESSTTQMPRLVANPLSSPAISSQEGNAASKTTTGGDSLSDIPGMEPEVQQGLEKQGIVKISQLLEQTSTKEIRAELAQNARIPTHQLKTLIDRADLMRLQGVEGDEAILLEEAGVAGCKDLQHRNPEHLYTTLAEGHARGLSASPAPTLDQLTQWIAEAKAITAAPRRVNK